MTTINLDLPDSNALSRETQGELGMARTMVINSPQMFELAATDLKRIKARIVALEETRKAITRPLDEAKSNVMELFRIPVETLKSAEGALKQSMLTYTQEQQRIAAEQQRLVEEAARKERERMAAEARRLEQEAAVAAAEAAQAASQQDTDPIAAIEAEQRTERAAALQMEAQAVAATAEMIVAPKVDVAAPVVKGISTRKTYTAEVVDIVALCRHIAEHPEHQNLVKADTTALKQMATALKENMNIPGVKLVINESLAARR